MTLENSLWTECAWCGEIVVKELMIDHGPGDCADESDELRRYLDQRTGDTVMTENEARQKRCCGPESRWVSNCIASKCMAWRWKYPPVGGVGSAVRHLEEGYCGLAGKPV